MRNYIYGLILSVALTLTAYFVTVNRLLSGWDFMLVIVGLAFIQFLVQLIFFLHLNHEEKPRWNFISFLATIGLILIVIIGSLVIMQNLNYHMPTDQEIMHDEAIIK